MTLFRMYINNKSLTEDYICEKQLLLFISAIYSEYHGLTKAIYT